MAAKRNNRWSSAVTHSSNALDLEGGIFKSNDPQQIALSLKQSAERSHRRRGTPYQSAMSMLTFYINRAGAKLSAGQKYILSQAKQELRHAFRKPAASIHPLK
jgi:hypothetical protein